MVTKLRAELPPIPSNSNGSYRDVYDLGDGTVVKVCRDPAKTKQRRERVGIPTVAHRPMQEGVDPLRPHH
jgi:hypothetical protein